VAEQYESVKNQGPNIDIQLYPDAVLKGAEAGQIIGSPLKSALTGATEGVSNYIKDTQGFQQIAANDTTNQINSDPDVIDARKTDITAGADLKEAQASTAQLQNELDTKNNDLNTQLTNADLQNKLNDANNQLTINSLSTLPQQSPDDIQTKLNDPNVQAAWAQHPDQAIQTLTALSGRKDIDQGQIQNMYSRYTAAAQLKNQADINKSNVEFANKQMLTNADKFDHAKGAALTTFGNDALNTTDGDGFEVVPADMYPTKPDPTDPSKRVLISDLKNGGYQMNTIPDSQKSIDQPWMAIANGKVVKQNMSYLEAQASKKDLDTWKEGLGYQQLIANGGTSVTGVRSVGGLKPGLPSPIAAQNTGTGLAGAAPTPAPDTSSGPMQSTGPAATDDQSGAGQFTPVDSSKFNQNVTADVDARNQQIFGKNGAPPQTYELAKQMVQKNRTKGVSATASTAVPTPTNAPTLSVSTPAPAGTAPDMGAVATPTPDLNPSEEVTPTAMATPTATPTATDTQTPDQTATSTSTPYVDSIHPVSSVAANEDHLSNLLGGANVNLQLASYDMSNRTVPAVETGIIKKINSIPAMANQAALIKGLVAIESSGNPNAVGPMTKYGTAGGCL
jgi:hypothetical protein